MKRLYYLFALLVLAPVSAFADSCGSSANGIQNPLSSAYCNIPSFIEGFLKAMVMIGLPIVAFFLLYSGYLFVSAQGNTESLNTAKENFKYVIIGAVLILGAWVLATLIGNTVSNIIGA
jgi:uncharacterized Tic20 family protein